MHERRHICIVYDCLYPYTVGGAERWYRNLAEQLATKGHDVTYLTMSQWGREAPPELTGVNVVKVAPRMRLYANGRRRIAPPLVFGLGVLGHLAIHGSEYDVVHTASFPYFPLLAAGLLRGVGRYKLVVDWHEVWSREYWREYLGPLGSLGFLVQSLCMRFRQEAICFSRLHERRLHAGRVAGRVTVLRGQYQGSSQAQSVDAAEPVVVFAGRHIPEKRVTAVLPALQRAREHEPELRGAIFGDGPDRPEVMRQVEELSLSGACEVPGFVDRERVEQALRTGLCLLLPSRREGYGLVVVEALASGTPAVVVAGPDNAAAELIEDGANGFVAASASSSDLGEAILRVHRGGRALRESTAEWFTRHARELSLTNSAAVVSGLYARRCDVAGERG